MSSVATTYSTNHDHRLRAFATAIDAGGVVGRRCSSARSLVGVAAMEPEHTHAFHSGRMALPNPRRSEERHRAGKTGIEQRLAMKRGAQRLGPPGGRMIAGQEGLYVYTYRGLTPWQKLTVSVNDGVYAALHRVIGRGFSRFLNDLPRLHGGATTIPDGYARTGRLQVGWEADRRIADEPREVSAAWRGVVGGVRTVGSPERSTRNLQEPRSCDRQQRCCKSGVDQTQWILPGAGAYRFRHFSLRAVSAAGGP
jgi:hypothetical protein